MHKMGRCHEHIPVEDRPEHHSATRFPLFAESVIVPILMQGIPVSLHRTTVLRRLLQIALPMVVSQASNTVMMFVDRLFLSRLGEAYLSAAMSGGLNQFMVNSLFIGTVGYTNAVVAQLFGANKKERCAEATVQGMILALLCYPIILAISPLVRHIFILAGQKPIQVALGYQYFRVLIFGSIFVVLRFAISGFFIGTGRTKVVMVSNVVGMVINIPANYVLIYGKFGFPALGLTGAAIGTILGNMIAFLILFTFYLRPVNRREFATHLGFRLVGETMRTLIRFGVPAGFEMILNVTAFNLFVQFMHSYGTGVAAAVTIAFNWDLVAFVPMLGMSYATTALVGQFVGAKDYAQARHATNVSLRVAWVYSGTMVLVFLTLTGVLVRTFAAGFGSGATDVAWLAAILIRLAALYILADSAQLVFSGALRGAGDTRWVMQVSVGLHWVFSVLAIVLIRVLQVSPVASWISFIIFVVLLGLAMFLRFRSGRWQEIRMIE
jgi:MATE family multidrug resistance protein